MTHQELEALVIAQGKKLATLEANMSRGFQRLHGSALALTAGLEEVGKHIALTPPPQPINPEASPLTHDELAAKIREIGARLGIKVSTRIAVDDGHEHLKISVAGDTPEEKILAFNREFEQLTKTLGTYSRKVSATGGGEVN